MLDKQAAFGHSLSTAIVLETNTLLLARSLSTKPVLGPNTLLLARSLSTAIVLGPNTLLLTLSLSPSYEKGDKPTNLYEGLSFWWYLILGFFNFCMQISIINFVFHKSSIFNRKMLDQRLNRLEFNRSFC